MSFSSLCIFLEKIVLDLVLKRIDTICRSNLDQSISNDPKTVCTRIPGIIFLFLKFLNFWINRKFRF